MDFRNKKETDFNFNSLNLIPLTIYHQIEFKKTHPQTNLNHRRHFLGPLAAILDFWRPSWIRDRFQDGAEAYFVKYGLKYQNQVRKP